VPQRQLERGNIGSKRGKKGGDYGGRPGKAIGGKNQARSRDKSRPYQLRDMVYDR